METGFTGIAGMGRRSVNAVHGPGKNLGRTRFPGPARARKEIGMRYLVRLYRFLQCLRNMDWPTTSSNPLGRHLRYSAMYAIDTFPSVYEKSS